MIDEGVPEPAPSLHTPVLFGCVFHMNRSAAAIPATRLVRPSVAFMFESVLLRPCVYEAPTVWARGGFWFFAFGFF